METLNQAKLIPLKVAKADITAYFNSLPRSTLKYSDIAKIVSEQSNFWRLTGTTTVYDFIKFMLDATKLERVEFNFPNRKEIRYLWGDAPLYEVVMSLNPDGYLSHYTAMYLHDLTEQVPKTIYLNREQPPPPNRGKRIDQQAIDNAFKRPVRISKNVATYKNYSICTVSSMGSGKIGIVESIGPAGETIFVTDIERTLIDISVRPVYSGGVFEVLNAFSSAKGKVSLNKMAAMLKKMNFVYPYHQVIGFYLERSEGYKESSINLFRKFDISYNFYLTQGMKEMDFSEKWRLYFPKGF